MKLDEVTNQEMKARLEHSKLRMQVEEQAEEIKGLQGEIKKIRLSHLALNETVKKLITMLGPKKV